MFLTFIGVLVCSGFCIVYSEQGTFIIRDNWLKIKVGILLPFTVEFVFFQLTLLLLSPSSTKSTIYLYIL